eukprot:CAMPEP_0197643490 /NCGR_PEP_ID=MMETSP1338-20131121/16788_1 /TAXON_ID=43686 ORGANISM="Pelagodinium beii, Strain RCC1491" /NCGR_SAMPLE_ID=MMETSP1338 /ASSEMBLY_ACC=CAM_ASM_000754 /LENGTH=106 /DNA_ID=CAMNT_0043216753 /DNA_START=206 /DNA_END=523 /DNA_ORIENTATION=+
MSLFNRGGPNSLLDEYSVSSSHRRGSVSWSISLTRSRPNRSRAAGQLQNRSTPLAAMVATHTANSGATGLLSSANKNQPAVLEQGKAAGSAIVLNLVVFATPINQW